jgi:hypothetical protein
MATSATITTEPNKLLAEKTDDDRMPVIVKRQDYEKWIEPGDEARPPIDRIRPIVNATVSTPESERSAYGVIPYFTSRKACNPAGRTEASSCHVRIFSRQRRSPQRTALMAAYQLTATS